SIDILLLPSLYEGFPVVALEIQAAGKPALFSDQIDSSSKITDLVHFVSLKKSNSDWAKAIDYVLKSYNNIDFKHELTAAGYNINEEIKKLDYLYRQFIKNI
ncbi:glycosyltransferase, partial [Faecalicatena contorta]|uniref:glycosyltransferase n=1 Tax=Faecalicatena contorta TaxID=39482 RepID=UPI001F250422